MFDRQFALQAGAPDSSDGADLTSHSKVFHFSSNANLARITHEFSTAAAKTSALTALRFQRHLGGLYNRTVSCSSV